MIEVQLPLGSLSSPYSVSLFQIIRLLISSFRCINPMNRPSSRPKRFLIFEDMPFLEWSSRVNTYYYGLTHFQCGLEDLRVHGRKFGDSRPR